MSVGLHKRLVVATSSIGHHFSICL